MFDFTGPGFPAYMENEGCISRVAKVLNQNPNDVIDTDEFLSACYKAGVDPDSFSQEDLDRLQEMLK